MFRVTNELFLEEFCKQTKIQVSKYKAITLKQRFPLSLQNNTVPFILRFGHLFSGHIALTKLPDITKPELNIETLINDSKQFQSYSAAENQPVTRQTDPRDTAGPSVAVAARDKGKAPMECDMDIDTRAYQLLERAFQLKSDDFVLKGLPDNHEPSAEELFLVKELVGAFCNKTEQPTEIQQRLLTLLNTMKTTTPISNYVPTDIMINNISHAVLLNQGVASEKGKVKQLTITYSDISELSEEEQKELNCVFQVKNMGSVVGVVIDDFNITVGDSDPVQYKAGDVLSGTAATNTTEKRKIVEAGLLYAAQYATTSKSRDLAAQALNELKEPTQSPASTPRTRRPRPEPSPTQKRKLRHRNQVVAISETIPSPRSAAAAADADIEFQNVSESASLSVTVCNTQNDGSQVVVLSTLGTAGTIVADVTASKVGGDVRVPESTIGVGVSNVSVPEMSKIYVQDISKFYTNADSKEDCKVAFAILSRDTKERDAMARFFADSFDGLPFVVYIMVAPDEDLWGEALVACMELELLSHVFKDNCTVEHALFMSGTSLLRVHPVRLQAIAAEFPKSSSIVQIIDTFDVKDFGVLQFGAPTKFVSREHIEALATITDHGWKTICETLKSNMHLSHHEFSYNWDEALILTGLKYVLGPEKFKDEIVILPGLDGCKCVEGSRHAGYYSSEELLEEVFTQENEVVYSLVVRKVQSKDFKMVSLLLLETLDESGWKVIEAYLPENVVSYYKDTLDIFRSYRKYPNYAELYLWKLKDDEVYTLYGSLGLPICEMVKKEIRRLGHDARQEIIPERGKQIVDNRKLFNTIATLESKKLAMCSLMNMNWLRVFAATQQVHDQTRPSVASSGQGRRLEAQDPWNERVVVLALVDSLMDTGVAKALESMSLD
jgi:hypothetical protein